MTPNRIFWLMLLAIAVYIGAGQLAGYIGSAVGSIWAAGGIGIAAGLIAQFAFQPFVKQAQRDGYLEKPAPMNASMIAGKIAVFAVVTVFIIFAGSPSSGSVDYTKPFVIGFWAAVLTLWIASSVKSRKLDSPK